MSTPAPAAPAAPASGSDGKTLGIVGLILAFVFALVGLIVSLVAKSQSKRAGVPNGPATAGIVLSIIFLVLQVVFIVVLASTGFALFSQCATYGPGVHTLDNGVTLTCG